VLRETDPQTTIWELLVPEGEERGTGLVHRRAWVVLGVLGMGRQPGPKHSLRWTQ
jgi:hypothetical protein